MNFKIVTFVTASLLSVSGGDLAPELRAHAPNQAISSISFHRDDVPLSYKYSAIHTKPSPRPTENKNANYYQKSGDPINFRSIQYAPLIKPGELRFQNAMYTKKSLHSPHNLLNDGGHPNVVTQKERKPLEPRIDPNQVVVHPLPISHIDYIPGHNIEVLRTVNRSPGHNAVYRSNPEGNAPAEKQNKMNYLNQYIIYQPNSRDTNPKAKPVWLTSATIPPTTTVTPVTTTTVSPQRIPYAVNAYAYMPKANYQLVDISKGLKQQLQKAPYTKMHALLLNVARAYNMALTPHKSLHAGANPSVLANVPVHSQNLLKAPGTSQLHPPALEQKTVMYPVQKNLHFAIHS